MSKAIVTVATISVYLHYIFNVYLNCLLKNSLGKKKTEWDITRYQENITRNLRIRNLNKITTKQDTCSRQFLDCSRNNEQAVHNNMLTVENGFKFG